MMVRLIGWKAYATLTMFSWGAWAFLSKVFLQEASPAGALLLTGLSFLGAGCLVGRSVRRWRTQSEKNGWVFALLAGSIGGLGNIAFYSALEHGPTDVVVPLSSLSPVVTVIFGRLALDERLTARQYVGIIAALLAGYLLSQ